MVDRSQIGSSTGWPLSAWYSIPHGHSIRASPFKVDKRSWQTMVTWPPAPAGAPLEPGAASSPAGHARAAGKRPGGKLASRTGGSTLVRGRLAAGRRNRRSVSCGVWPGVTHYGGHGSSGVEIRRGVFGGGCAGPPPFSALLPVVWVMWTGWGVEVGSRPC